MIKIGEPCSFFLSVFKKYNMQVLLALLFSCLIYALWKESRAFVIGFTVSLVFIGHLFKSFRISRYLMSVSLTSIFTLIFILTFMFKSDSTQGRILIYKISFDIFKEFYLVGIGLGGFKQKYLLYQALYFSNDSFTVKELLLADNTYFAFNDYWQFTIEAGILGLIALALILVLLTFLIRKALWKNRVDRPVVLLLAVAQMLAINVAAFFTHVFEKLHFQTLYLICVIVVCYYVSESFKRWSLLTAGITIASLLYLHFNLPLHSYMAYKRFEEAKELAFAGYSHESLEILMHIYPSMKSSHAYQMFYGEMLLKNEKLSEAEKILRMAAATVPANSLYVQLGNCFQRQKKMVEAERAYRLAVNMVPNRLSSRYTLFQFYISCNRTAEAIKVGIDILSIPVKIHSHYSQLIRSDTKTELKELMLRIKHN